MQIREDVSPSQFYGRSYAEPGQFPIDLFLLNLETSSVEGLVEGFKPTVI